MIKIAMASLGCAKNLVDAENMIGALRSAGYEITSNEAKADVIIINTCCFIESAKQESIDTILELSQNRGKLVVAGCMASRYSEEILKELPEVTVVTTIGANIISAVRMALSGSRKIIAEKDLEYNKRERSTPPYTAYLQISDGCDNNCTYCVIPSIRGKYKSRPIQEIYEEAREMVADGVKELIIIAQDTTSYGIDLYGKLMLPELLKELCTLDVTWIRLHYCYPERITDELIEVIKNEDKICKYIDVPIQHCSDVILKKMGRKGSKIKIFKVLEKLRKIPNIVIRSTLITGFPTETEEQFLELVEFVKTVKLDRLGVFAYSQEEGTPAARIKEQIPKRTRQSRANKIMRIQSEISKKLNQARVSTILTVLVEDSGVGRTYADSIDIDGKVYFEGGISGEFVQVLITDFDGYDLYGHIVE